MLEELTAITNRQLKFAPKRYAEIREICQSEYGWLEMESFRASICWSIISDNSFAAMTSTNSLLEFALKSALVSDSLKPADEEFDGDPMAKLLDEIAEPNREIGSQVLDWTIRRACTQGLISKTQKKELLKFKDDFRNAYSHMDLSKLFGDTSIPVTVISIDAKSITKRGHTTARLSDAGFLAGMAIPEHAKQNAIPYFRYVDALVRELKRTVFPNAISIEAEVGRQEAGNV